MTRSRVISLIESLLMKADPQYNDNEHERKASIAKIRELCKKYNIDYSKKVPDEEPEPETKRKKAFEAFKKAFYINRNGNYVFRVDNGDYITIKHCKNGAWFMVYKSHCHFFDTVDKAFIAAWIFYKKEGKNDE